MPVMFVMALCSNGNSGCTVMAATSITFTLLVGMTIVAVKIRLAVFVIAVMAAMVILNVMAIMAVMPIIAILSFLTS